ncbi:MAG: DNA replication protein [Rhodospirillales bacterium]|nr:DNA replication protein [Rhodospirillales bacterium]
MIRQLALELAPRTALGREDFLVAPANAKAVAWIDRWPDWSASALVVAGPEGSGKSHLVQVYAARTGARVLAAASLAALDPPELVRSPALAVEDGDRMAPERPLLHLLNLAAETGIRVLITARAAPARWSVGLPDLRSRLLALPVATIEPPDDALLAAVLAKLFADRQLRVGAEALAYLAGRIERSFRAASEAVARADARALSSKRNLSIALLREVIAEMGGEP